jgi:hypothetical protein
VLTLILTTIKKNSEHITITVQNTQAWQQTTFHAVCDRINMRCAIKRSRDKDYRVDQFIITDEDNI